MEKDTTDKKRSWIFRGLIIILNLLILYIITDMDIFFTINLIFIVSILLIRGIIAVINKIRSGMNIGVRGEIYKLISKISKQSKISTKKVSKAELINNLNLSLKLINTFKDSISLKKEGISSKAIQEEITLLSKSDLRETKFKPKKTSIIDSFRMSMKYLKVNRKYIFISLMGLLLSTLILSQSYLLVASYEQNHFSTYMENKDITAYDINTPSLWEDLRYDYIDYITAQKERWNRSSSLGNKFNRWIRNI